MLNANTGKVEDIGNASDLFRALQLLQKILSPEDFEKYEKVLIPPKAEKAKRREEALLEMVQTQERLEKQEMGHVEQISKLEHNLEQQKLMLQEVRSRLGTVREDVAALRALVADPSEPNGNDVQPPLPPPLHPPPVIEEIGAQIDIEPENLPLGEKKRGALEAKKSLVKKKGKKGTTKPLAKFLEAENMEEEEEISGVDVAGTLGQMSQGQLQEVADNAPPELVRLLLQRTQKEKEKEKESWASAAGSVAAESCG